MIKYKISDNYININEIEIWLYFVRKVKTINEKKNTIITNCYVFIGL